LIFTVLLVAACGATEGTPAVVDDDPIGTLHLIPAPRMVSGGVGHLHFDSSSRIAVSADTETIGEILASSLRPSTGWRWNVTRDEPLPGDIVLRLDEAQADLGEEGYFLVVDGRHATVRALSLAGLFYGTQSLLQLLPPEVELVNAVVLNRPGTCEVTAINQLLCSLGDIEPGSRPLGFLHGRAVVIIKLYGLVY